MSEMSPRPSRGSSKEKRGSYVALQITGGALTALNHVPSDLPKSTPVDQMNTREKLNIPADI